MPLLTRYLDPRRSLAAAIGLLMFALSVGFVLVATVWLGDIVRTSLLDQRARELDRTADRIAIEVNLDLALRVQSMRALAAMLTTELQDDDPATLRRSLDNVRRASPQFDWFVVANPQGRVIAATDDSAEGTSVADRSWFLTGLKGSRLGDVRRVPDDAKTRPGTHVHGQGPLVDLAAPVIDARSDTVAVVGTQLGTRWLLDIADGMRRELRESAGTEALLLDADGTVLIGPSRYEGRRWEGAPVPADGHAPILAADGTRYLAAQAKPVAFDALQSLGWRLEVLQPLQDATQSARALQRRIAAVLLGLGLVAAALGALLARRLTRDLEVIARSADAIRAGTTQRIAVPRGGNEAALLGRALDGLLTSLQRERAALQTLNSELDRRVAARTREVERMAEQARYDAVVRERLKIARDLHDTLAHSMMAMLAEVRLLRRLWAVDPGAMADELTRAEATAHQGLNEARAAIAQMRFNPVRDAGLAAALGDLVKMFVERTGIPVQYASDAQAGAFADERAEALFRIAEEAMRNVERHSGATRVDVALRASPDGRDVTLTIADDGVGFDAAAAHPGHYGLAGLREQARLIGASLAIQSAPQQGTTITAALRTEPSS